MTWVEVIIVTLLYVLATVDVLIANSNDVILEHVHFE